MSLGSQILKDCLERRFNLVSSTQVESDFFLEVCNYLYFLTSDDRLRPIIGEIINEREHAFKNYLQLEKQTVEKLQQIRKDLYDLLIKNGADAKEVQNLFEHFDGLNTGKIHVDSPLWLAFEEDLLDIFEKVVSKYPNITIDQFATKERDKITLAPSYKETRTRLWEELQLIELMRKTAVWGAWERLLLVYEAAYTSDSEWREKYERNPLVGLGLSLLIGEMRNIISGKSSLNNLEKRIHFSRIQCFLDLRRVHNYLLDHMDRTSLGFALLRKYKQRCEWYDREKILHATENQDSPVRDKNEADLTRQLATYLHDNGVMPLAQIIFGTVRPDMLGLYSHEELFPIEVKVVRKNENERLKIGFNQILTYIRTIDVGEGFYVVFCRGDFTLDIPQTVLTNDLRINIIPVDLSETPPSTRSPNVWRVTKEDLLGSA